MLKNTVVDHYNINLINYNAIFRERVELVVIDELYDLNLLIDDNLNFDKTAATAMSHHIINSLCQYIIDNRNLVERPVFVICPECLNKGELNNYLTEKKNLGEFVVKQFDKLKNILGINAIVHDWEFEDFVDSVATRDGGAIELINSIDKTSPRDLHRLYKYVESTGLKAIKNKFFEEQVYKQVFI